MIADVMRHLFTPDVRRRMWLRRVAEAHVWRDAERAQAAEHDAAVRRIRDQAQIVPDPVRRGRRD
jgi:hypothetical protein